MNRISEHYSIPVLIVRKHKSISLFNSGQHVCGAGWPSSIVISQGMQASITAVSWHPHPCWVKIHFLLFFPMYHFKTYPLFFLSSDSHFCHTSRFGLPPSSSQQYIPICPFFISSRFATVPKAVISSIFFQTMLASWTGLLQYEWICAQSSPIIVHPRLTNFCLSCWVIEQIF